MTNDEWLKSQCNRYINGVCLIKHCLVRGGEHSVCGDHQNYNKSTCEIHETIVRIQKLEEKLAVIERVLV